MAKKTTAKSTKSAPRNKKGKSLKVKDLTAKNVSNVRGGQTIKGGAIPVG